MICYWLKNEYHVLVSVFSSVPHGNGVSSRTRFLPTSFVDFVNGFSLFTGTTMNTDIPTVLWIWSRTCSPRTTNFSKSRPRATQYYRCFLSPVIVATLFEFTRLYLFLKGSRIEKKSSKTSFIYLQTQWSRMIVHSNMVIRLNFRVFRSEYKYCTVLKFRVRKYGSPFNVN